MANISNIGKAREINKNSNNRIIELFYPGNDFPAISITGTQCELSCAHCNRVYLKHMKHVKSSTELVDLCLKIAKQNANGILISGGCDQDGHVMFDNFLDALYEIKSKTKLIINIHTGVITKKLAIDLAKIDIDVVSIDIVGASETIKNVYGLEHSTSEYRSTLKALTSSGIKKVVPHICIGLHYGKILGEFNAIDMVSEIEPVDMVFLVLIPTPGTGMEKSMPPTIDEVVEIIEYAKGKCPSSNLYLGCMRPKTVKFRGYNYLLEQAVIDAGINGIVLPSKKVVNKLNEKDIKTRIHRNCCAV